MSDELKVGEIYKGADDKKVTEIKAKATELIAKYEKADVSEIAKILEHWYIFGTEDLNSIIQEEGAPISEHYKLDDLIQIVKEVK